MMSGQTIKEPVVYLPRSADDAAVFLRRCSELKAAGKPVSVSIMESPFRLSAPAGEHISTDSCEKAMETAGVAETGGPVHISLSHGGLTGALEVSKSDLLVVAGGGVGLADLRNAVKKEGLFFPFDSELAGEDQSLAGLVLDGTVSRFEGRYGRLRENILSLGIVTPSGEVIRTGSHSVKDVAGYELAGFITGAGGRCGMIHSITMRLLPLPGTRSTIALSGDPAGLNLLAGDIYKKMNPAAIEIYNGITAEFLSGEAGSGSKALMISEFHTSIPGARGDLVSRVKLLVKDSAISVLEDFPQELDRKSFLARITSHYGEGEELIYLTADLKKARTPSDAGILSWISFYPLRGHYIWLAGESGEDHPVPPGVGDVIRNDLAGGARVRAEMILRKGEKFFRRRFPSPDMTGREKPFFREVENGDLISGISEDISRVFDPERIMLA